MVVEKLLRKVLVDPLLWTLMLSLPLALLPRISHALLISVILGGGTGSAYLRDYLLLDCCYHQLLNRFNCLLGFSHFVPHDTISY